MTTDLDARSDEIRRLRRMLTGLGELAEHASLTGSLERGVSAAVRRYNSVLQRLEVLQAVPHGFSRLGDEAGFDEIRVECAMLAGYLKDDDHGGRYVSKGGPASGRGKAANLQLVIGLAPFVERRELMELLRAHHQEGEPMDPELILALAPFLPKEEVSRLVRQNLGQWGKAKEATTSEPSAVEHASESPMLDEPAGAFGSLDEPDEQRRLDELDDRIDALAIELRQGDLSAEDRSRLLDEVSRVAGERAELRRALAQE